MLLPHDRQDVWRVGKYFLEKCGADVTIVEDGKQAVHAVVKAKQDNAPFALIVMDRQMHVMTGHPVCSRLHRLARWQIFFLPGCSS
ncbi:MAG TPA: hypothetical protein DDZ51_04390 [Planctomycetaceae bacterium]|nr:hypothetical protein [Planctomycetaceae bacterium]